MAVLHRNLIRPCVSPMCGQARLASGCLQGAVITVSVQLLAPNVPRGSWQAKLAKGLLEIDPPWGLLKKWVLLKKKWVLQKT